MIQSGADGSSGAAGVFSEALPNGSEVAGGRAAGSSSDATGAGCLSADRE
jgi:hypothetical protein